MGTVKTKALARSYIWWPKIDSDVEHLINNCSHCQKLLPSPEKSSLIPWTPTDSVWSRIHIDFAGPIKNFYVLIIIDSFSKWAEVFKTKNITSAFTINKLREVFCRYGLIDTLVSDNGTQFTSDDFKTFMLKNNIKHILTPPGHPATNGQAENFVKTFKKSILACLMEEQNVDIDTAINRFLIDYRNTVHCTTAESPAKLFFGRSLKTRFSSLRPPLTKDKIIENQIKSVNNFKGNRNVHFVNGQKAHIKKKIGPRTYECILLHNNREIKRHVDQIRGENISIVDDTSKLRIIHNQNSSSDDNITIM